MQNKQAILKLNSLLWSEQIHKKHGKEKMYYTAGKCIRCESMDSTEESKLVATEMGFPRGNCR